MAATDRWLLAWALGYVGVGAASLLVPLYAVALGGDAFLVGVLGSTAAFAAVPGALLWGWLAARTGRRREFVLLALGATAGVLAIVPLVETPWPLVAVNTVLWFVVSAAAPVLTLLVVEGTAAREWEARIGRLNAWQGYGWVGGLALGSAWIPALAPVLGPGLARRWLFWACALAAAVATVLAARWLPRRATVDPDRLDAAPRLLARIDRGAGRYVRSVPFATTRLYWAIRSIDLDRLGAPGRRPLRGYLLGVGVFSAWFAIFWAPLPAYLAPAYPEAQIFWFFLVTNLAAAAFYTRVGAWGEAVGGRRLQAGALSARALLFPLVAVVVLSVGPPVELPALLLVFGGIGLTWAVIAVTATSFVTRLGGDDQGTALGLYAAVAGGGGAIGGVFGGWLATAAGFSLTFAVAGAIVLAGALVVLLVDGPLGVPSPPGGFSR